MVEESKKHTFMNWLVTIPYIVIFFMILTAFHPVLLCASWVNLRWHKWLLDRMNVCIMWNIRLTTGASYTVINRGGVVQDRPVILVANHQSMYDIPMLMWELRDRDVGFIAKKELGKGLPSISLSLRKLSSVLIDRKDANQAIAAIRAFGKEREAQCEVAAIFPEGTRARDGTMKRFRNSGLKALIETMPSAVIQPVAIRGNWELLRYNFWPIPFGTSVSVEFLEPVACPRSEEETQKCLSHVEEVIRAKVLIGK